MLKDMKSYAHLKPGRKGTRRLVEKYGDALLCVRYRYDEKRGLRLKTAEIIVEAKPGSPCLRFRNTDIVSVMVPFTAKALRENEIRRREMGPGGEAGGCGMVQSAAMPVWWRG